MIADHHLNVRDLRLTLWSNFSLLGFWSMAVKQFQQVILAFLLRIALGRVRKEK
jgi:hypothetical protein